MRDYDKRLLRLEKRAGIAKNVTLETLVAASWGNLEAMSNIEAASPVDPLLRSIIETESKGASRDDRC